MTLTLNNLQHVICDQLRQLHSIYLRKIMQNNSFWWYVCMFVHLHFIMYRHERNAWSGFQIHKCVTYFVLVKLTKCKLFPILFFISVHLFIWSLNMLDLSLVYFGLATFCIVWTWIFRCRLNSQPFCFVSTFSKRF